MSVTFGKRIFESLNNQIKEELIIGYTLLSMSSVFADMNLKGCEQWAREQSQNRLQRSQKIFDHIILRGAKVKLMPIPAPKHDWRAPLHMFEEVSRIEQRTSGNFTAMVEIATAEKDYASLNFLQWFVEEQIKNDAF